MPVLPSYRNQSVDLHNKSLTDFYMKATLAFKGLIIKFYEGYTFLKSVSFI